MTETTAPVVRRATRLATSSALVGLLALVVVTGCSTGADTGVASAGGGAAAPEQSAAPVASLSADDQRLQFVQCLRDNGVDVPDDGLSHGPGAIDLQSQQVQDALEACEDSAPNMGGDGPSGPMSAEQQAQFMALAECMRDEGIDFPDPTFDADGNLDVSAMKGGEISPSDPEVQAAFRGCSDKVDFQMPGGGN